MTTKPTTSRPGETAARPASATSHNSVSGTTGLNTTAAGKPPPPPNTNPRLDLTQRPPLHGRTTRPPTTTLATRHPLPGNPPHGHQPVRRGAASAVVRVMGPQPASPRPEGRPPRARRKHGFRKSVASTWQVRPGPHRYATRTCCGAKGRRHTDRHRWNQRRP